MSSPAISVVMPVYNAERYLHEAIESILNQTFTNYELIIINDGSSDSSEEIILSYKDQRIKYLKNRRNLRLPQTLNKAIKLAEGRYIARMDADDISLPERLKEQYSFMEKNKEIGVCGTWAKTIGAKGANWKYYVEDSKIKACLLFNSSFLHSSVVIRAEIIKKHFYKDIYLFAQDYGLWVEISKITKFHNIPYYLLKYRLHQSQTNTQEQLRVANEIRKMMLANIGCNLDDKEFNIFERIARGVQTNIGEAESIFNKILSSNLKSQYLEQRALETIIGDSFWSVLNNDKEYSLQKLSIFAKSQFSKYISLPPIYFLKFLTKCLINYHKG